MDGADEDFANEENQLKAKIFKKNKKGLRGLGGKYGDDNQVRFH